MYDHLIGKNINGFIVESKLAEGGMGAVYRAKHQILDLHKVIKVMRPEIPQHELPALVARFEREARAAARLRHDAILAIDGYGRLENGLPWLMTPYLQGVALDDYLRQRGPLGEQAALPILLQLTSALEHAHAAQVVHRDIKPGNVFLCEGGSKVKLLDFGIAKILGEDYDDGAQTRSGIAIGTPSYMPPEQYQSAHHAGPSADIYALAIMAYQMVTGELPWGHADRSVLYYRQRTEAPKLSSVSSGWQYILGQALRKDPTERPDARTFGIGLTEATRASARQITPLGPNAVTLSRPPTTLVPHIPTPLVAPLPPMPPVTTLGLSTAVLTPVPTPSARKPWYLVLLALGTSLLATLVTFAVFTILQARPTRYAKPITDAGLDRLDRLDAAPVDAGIDTTVTVDAGVDAAMHHYFDARTITVHKPSKPSKSPQESVSPHDKFDPDSPSGR